MSDMSSRTKTGFRAGIFGITTNLLAFFVKIAAGVISGSVTIAADAVNSLTDAGSSILTLIGFKLASKPADREHPYGHARYEDLTAMIISIIMLTVGVLFAKNSIEKIITPSELSITPITFGALIFAIILKAAQSIVNLSLSKKIDSIALRAAAQDSRNDAIITSTVLLSIIVMSVFNINIDGIAGLAVSLFVIFSSVKTFKSSISPMLGSPPSDEIIEEVTNIIKSRSEILGFHDLRIHNYGPGANFGSVHCEVDGEGKIKDIHEVVDGIEKEVGSRLGVVITVHTDPIDIPKSTAEKTENEKAELRP